jgi:hypothetical protein
MKTITKVMLVIALTVGLLGVSAILAEREYDVKTVETITGRVLSVENITVPKRRGYLVQVMLQTDREVIPIHLGPLWFIVKETPRIEVNDIITVTGSRMMLDGRTVVVAADIAKGNELLKLRQNDGIPFWPLHH